MKIRKKKIVPVREVFSLTDLHQSFLPQSRMSKKERTLPAYSNRVLKEEIIKTHNIFRMWISEQTVLCSRGLGCSRDKCTYAHSKKEILMRKCPKYALNLHCENEHCRFRNVPLPDHFFETLEERSKCAKIIAFPFCKLPLDVQRIIILFALQDAESLRNMLTLNKGWSAFILRDKELLYRQSSLPIPGQCGVRYLPNGLLHGMSKEIVENGEERNYYHLGRHVATEFHYPKIDFTRRVEYLTTDICSYQRKVSVDHAGFFYENKFTEICGGITMGSPNLPRSSIYTQYNRVEILTSSECRTRIEWCASGQIAKYESILADGRMNPYQIQRGTEFLLLDDVGETKVTYDWINHVFISSEILFLDSKGKIGRFMQLPRNSPYCYKWDLLLIEWLKEM